MFIVTEYAALRIRHAWTQYIGHVHGHLSSQSQQICNLSELQQTL